MNLAASPQSGQAMLEPKYPFFSPRGRVGGRRRRVGGRGRGVGIRRRRRVRDRAYRRVPRPCGVRLVRGGAAVGRPGPGRDFHDLRRAGKASMAAALTWGHSGGWVKRRGETETAFPPPAESTETAALLHHTFSCTPEKLNDAGVSLTFSRGPSIIHSPRKLI